MVYSLSRVRLYPVYIWIWNSSIQAYVLLVFGGHCLCYFLFRLRGYHKQITGQHFATTLELFCRMLLLQYRYCCHAWIWKIRIDIMGLSGRCKYRSHIWYFHVGGIYRYICEEIHEMTGPSQSPRDRILWILANCNEKMERSDLRRRMGMRYADQDPILEELAIRRQDQSAIHTNR